MELKVVQKEGQNKGRKYWGCPNYPKCKGFFWADTGYENKESKYTEEDKEAFKRKDQMNARQSAYKGITNLLAAGIEAGLLKKMPTNNEIMEKVEKHAKYIYDGEIDLDKNLETEDIPF